MHGTCHEQMGIRRPSEYSFESACSDERVAKQIKELTCIFESLTNGWPLPSFSARILYPRLCQSMITFDPLS